MPATSASRNQRCCPAFGLTEQTGKCPGAIAGAADTDRVSATPAAVAATAAPAMPVFCCLFRGIFEDAENPLSGFAYDQQYVPAACAVP